MNCPTCNHDNLLGAVFCAGCLMPLETSFPVAAPAPVNIPPPVQAPRALGSPAAPHPRLVLLDNAQPTGQVVVLPAGPYASPLLLGRNDLAGGVVVDVDLTRYGGTDRKVSRRHALVTAGADGRYSIEDWESAHGTWVNKRKLARGVPTALAVGDEVRLAEMVARFEIA